MASQDPKRKLRAFLCEKRRALSDERRKSASDRLLIELYPMLASYQTVMSFASMPDEIDLTPINNLLAKEGRLVLPRLEPDIVPYLIRDMKTCILSEYNIREPDPKKAQRVSTIDAVLVPGLGFDEAHHRIGFGQGHYDRFLEKRECVTYGVGFKEQLHHEHFPMQAHDISLVHLVLT